MPVVMVSSLTERGAETTLKALELGAFDFVSKPKVDVAGTLADFSDEILAQDPHRRRRTRGRRARARRRWPSRPSIRRTPSCRRSVRPRGSACCAPPIGIIAVGASTGGTEAIRELLVALPPDCPAMVIAQHIPAAFSGAVRAPHGLASVSSRSASRPTASYIMPGHVYIAPGGRHLLVERDGARYRCRLNDGPPVNRHIPSVDVLFRSVAQQVGPNAVGVILTGMGDDGARGLKEMHDAGAPTVAQDEASSVVWGMPGAAVKLGAVDEVVPLAGWPTPSCGWCSRPAHMRPSQAVEVENRR